VIAMENVFVDRGVTVVEMDRSYDGLDGTGQQRLGELLRKLIETADPPLILLDLSRTAIMDSTVLGILFGAEKRLRARQGRMAVCGANVFCADVLRIVNLDALFQSYQSREDAVEAMTAPTA
jgi:anti-anti-sigma factor